MEPDLMSQMTDYDDYRPESVLGYNFDTNTNCFTDISFASEDDRTKPTECIICRREFTQPENEDRTYKCQSCHRAFSFLGCAFEDNITFPCNIKIDTDFLILSNTNLPDVDDDIDDLGVKNSDFHSTHSIVVTRSPPSPPQSPSPPLLPPVNKKQNICKYCKKEFSQVVDLKRHLRTHTGEKPFKCDICSKTFSQVGSYSTHLRLHTGEKPFKCKDCKKEFTHSYAYSRHIRIHTGEKPFKCNICQIEMSHENSYKNHLKIHTGEKPFHCHVCGKDFTQIGNFRAHFRTHTGEKPYKCKQCDKQFCFSNQLSKHIDVVHSIKA